MTDVDTTIFSTKAQQYAGLLMEMTKDSIANLKTAFNITDENVFKVEIECRYVFSNTEKHFNSTLSKLLSSIGDKSPPSTMSTEDINYSADVAGSRMTLRKQTRIDRSDQGATSTWMVKYNIYPDKINPRESGPIADVKRIKRNKYLELSNYFHQRGLKIAVSVEFAKPDSFNPPPDSPRMTRYKNRTSFTEGKGDYAVQWDLTKVKETSDGEIKYEIELEKNVSFAKLTETVINNHIKSCRLKGMTYVYSTPVLPIPVASDSRSSIYTNNVSMAVTSLIECLTERPYRGDDKAIPSVPSSLVPQVVNFQVQNLLVDNYQEFCVTPKADGYRYFMVVQEEYVVLIQPPNTFKVIPKHAQKHPRPGSTHLPSGYIFDGELVLKENVSDNLPLDATVDYVYYIFDVAKFPDGKVFDTLMERYVIIEREIFSRGISEDTSYIKCGKMLVNLKPYLSASTSPWEAATHYFDQIEKNLHYETDGLIFTPNKSTYKDLVGNKSLKWKPEDMLTMDLRYMGDDQLYMFDMDIKREALFTGSKQHPITRKLKITNPRNIELINDIIYEFQYTPSTNEMRITRARTDKAAPNNSRVVVDVWNDIHNPIRKDVLCGMGFQGLNECRKEALWTWLSALCRNRSGKKRRVVDLSGIVPAVDIPVRFLDTVFQKMLLTCDFIPLSSIKNPLDIEDIDVLIVDGLMYDFLEGNIEDTLPIEDEEMFRLAHTLARKSKEIFIRGLPMHHSDIIVETASMGHMGELVIWRHDERTVYIDSINLGIFRNFNTGTYEVARVTSRIRNFPKESVIIPAGNRVGENFENLGPERILSGRLCGIWDYVSNVLIPSSHLRDNTSRMSINQNDDTILSEIIPETASQILINESPEKQDTIKIVPEDVLQTEAVTESNSQFTLESESKGDVFNCLAYAFFEMSKEVGINLDRENIKGHASELRILYNNLSGTDLVNTIHDAFGIGIVWVYMLDNEILGSSFPPMVGGKPPANGYILIAPSLMSVKELSEEMTLITTGSSNSPVTMPSSPIIASLMRKPTKAHYLTRTSKDLTKILLKEKITVSDSLTSCGLEIHYESLPFRTRLTKAGKTEYTEKDIIEVVEPSDISKLKKTENEILYDVNTTNTKNNILGYTLMKIRSGKLTKQK